MTFTYDLSSGELKATFETNNLQDALKHITYLDRVLRAATSCGFCNSHHIRLRARNTREGFEYYEYRCMLPDCGAFLQIHEQKNAARTMYVKLFEDGKPLPNRGWEKWDGKAESADTREAAPEPRDEEVPQTGRVR